MPSHTAWSMPARLKMAFDFCFILFYHSLTMLREASNETVAAKEAEVHLVEGSRCPGDPSSCTGGPEMREDQRRKERHYAEDPCQPPTGIPTLVNALLHSPQTKLCRRHIRACLLLGTF